MGQAALFPVSGCLLAAGTGLLEHECVEGGAQVDLQSSTFSFHRWVPSFPFSYLGFYWGVLVLSAWERVVTCRQTLLLQCSHSYQHHSFPLGASAMQAPSF